jgi:hypothetical protein
VDFQLKEVMDAVGPSAALAFAAWLFLQLLQQRYSAAYARYRELVDAFRTGTEGKRREVLKEEIDIYRQRVKYMLHSTNIGMVAAILLLLALVVNGLDAMLKLDWLKYIGAPAILLGLLLVIPAAIMIIKENMMIKRPIDMELADLKEFNGQPEAGQSRDGAERGRLGPRPV